MVRAFPWSGLHHKYKSRPLNNVDAFFQFFLFSALSLYPLRLFGQFLRYVFFCIFHRFCTRMSAKKYVCKSTVLTANETDQTRNACKSYALHLNKQLICANKLVCMQMVIVIYRSCVCTFKRSRMPFCCCILLIFNSYPGFENVQCACFTV